MFWSHNKISKVNINIEHILKNTFKHASGQQASQHTKLVMLIF